MTMLDKINTGTMPNDETGDPLQVAFRKINLVIDAINAGSIVPGSNNDVLVWLDMDC